MFLKSTKREDVDYLEAVYQECLEIEMNLRNIPCFFAGCFDAVLLKIGNLSKRMFLILNAMRKSSLSLKLLRNYVMNTVRRCLITSE